MSLLGAATPILRVFDETKTREFYLDFLGFHEDWRHRFADDLPLYQQVSRGDCRLHLSEHHGDACPGSALRIACADLEALAAELQAKAYRNARPEIVQMPWDERQLSLHDPFGNRLVFFAAS